MVESRSIYIRRANRQYGGSSVCDRKKKFLVVPGRQELNLELIREILIWLWENWWCCGESFEFWFSKLNSFLLDRLRSLSIRLLARSATSNFTSAQNLRNHGPASVQSRLVEKHLGQGKAGQTTFKVCSRKLSSNCYLHLYSFVSDLWRRKQD